MYIVGSPPDGQENLIQWVYEELQRISGLLGELERGVFLQTTVKLPDKPKDGQIVFADGVGWNPGNGKGFYGYYNSSWHFLG